LLAHHHLNSPQQYDDPHPGFWQSNRFSLLWFAVFSAFFLWSSPPTPLPQSFTHTHSHIIIPQLVICSSLNPQTRQFPLSLSLSSSFIIATDPLLHFLASLSFVFISLFLLPLSLFLHSLLVILQTIIHNLPLFTTLI
jgi:hypothetical protein